MDALQRHSRVQEKRGDGMSEKLKPCPFCGGEAKMMKMGYPHWVYCQNCGARVHGGKYGKEEGEKASAEAWNRRTE